MQLPKYKLGSAGILLTLRFLKALPAVLLVLLVACAAESNSPSTDSEEAKEPGTASLSPSEDAPVANVQEEESVPLKTVAQTTVKPEASTPEEVDEKSETVATERVRQTEEQNPAGSVSKAPTKPVPVRFPEMKVSPEQAQVTKLFLDANKAFKEERYVAAVQVLRKLDRMELGERQEEALDMFLARIEEVLGDGTDGEADSSTEETE